MLLIVLFYASFLICFNNGEQYNTCNFIQKWYKSEKDCIYDPEQYLSVPHIIAKHGYPSETHTVLTDDGYLLQLHRIPKSKNGKTGGPPVFLQHGVLGSSADWIISGNQSLGFILSDHGYDVWLGNARGNTYSRAHVSMPTESATFWNFSFHEMGTQDLPKVLYYVSNVTLKYGEIIYVGHSMGTTMFFVFSSIFPEAAENVKLMVAMAPVAYMNHTQSPLRLFAPYSNKIESMTEYLGYNEFLPNNQLMKLLSSECSLAQLSKEMCESVMFSICGFDRGDFNENILPIILSKEPAGASTKTIIHYAQEIQQDGNFQQFNYGPEGNLIRYGSEIPPKYNVGNIQRPIYMMYGVNDCLANYTDVNDLAANLPNVKGVYKIKSDTFTHVDFLFGKHAENLVYKPLLKAISKYT